MKIPCSGRDHLSTFHLKPSSITGGHILIPTWIPERKQIPRADLPAKSAYVLQLFGKFISCPAALPHALGSALPEDVPGWSRSFSWPAGWPRLPVDGVEFYLN